MNEYEYNYITLSSPTIPPRALHRYRDPTKQPARVLQRGTTQGYSHLYPPPDLNSTHQNCISGFERSLHGFREVIRLVHDFLLVHSASKLGREILPLLYATHTQAFSIIWSRNATIGIDTIPPGVELNPGE